MIRVRMVPHLDEMKRGESGIHTVIRGWFKHLPYYGIELVGKKVDSFDILAVHAGMASRFSNDVRLVAHLHGVYWTADYPALAWEWAANESVFESLRRADSITVPSAWVAENIARDMRTMPTIIPHGIDWDEWQHDNIYDEYILAYAKNRSMDVCNPAFISELARRYPDKLFLCTFAPKDAPGNVRITGLIPHDKMKKVVQRASVLISPVKETFGILQLEALASGTPVLGYNYGGNKDLIQHGVDGYLARPLDIDDLSDGLDYCLQHRNTLSKNASELSKKFTWDIACEKLARVYEDALGLRDNNVSVVIPSYNYSHLIGRAIDSVLVQTNMVSEIIVVDDGSTDDGATERAVGKYSRGIVDVKYHRQNNAGVAVARNTGISLAKNDYIICLDADDQIAPEFVRACVESMNADPTLGIAYTGLLAVEPDGKSSVSAWPPEYDFDNMVYEGGINQIPTCCMFRKSMWERLGGYRSRYCPNGAGSEDAEFWLRAGLYGYKGKKVTDAPLFIYSYKSGRVSGDKSYKEINWRELHPSTKDRLHPFLCVAKPMNHRPSHPVRQYDEPLVSVIIPVGPGHKQHVFNALDSLESQTLRRWEAILVDDTGDVSQWSFDGVPDVLKAYPYVKLIKTKGKMGAGYARNRGVEIARASLILFLDADDNLLVPNALESMVDIWNETGEAVYTDYVGKSVITSAEADRLKDKKRLLDYNPESGLAMHLSHAEEYDCEKAVLQPVNPLYIWNLITTLIPKQWHDEIGGFDEKMPSWEDWEYWLRMARAGKCFVHLAEPMVAYRFYTGGRRETGIQMPQKLLSYIAKKLEGVETMPCRSCGGNRKVSVPIPMGRTIQTDSKLSDGDMILVTYDNPNRGQHKVVGAFTKINYGYRQGGGVEKFYVHIDDIKSYPDFFTPFSPPAVVAEQPKPIAPPPPVEIARPEEVVVSTPDFIDTMPASADVVENTPLDKPFDLQSIPGVTEHIAEVLHEYAVKSWEDVLEFGKDKLLQIDGIGDRRADAILEFARKSIT